MPIITRGFVALSLAENCSIRACLTVLTDWYLWIPSFRYLFFPSPFEFLFVSSEGEMDIFPSSFLLVSCLRLYGSTREHWPFEVHCCTFSMSTVFACIFFHCLYNVRFGFLSKLLFNEETCSLRSLKLLSLMFGST